MAPKASTPWIDTWKGKWKINWRWVFGFVAVDLCRSTKLPCVEPDWYWDGWPFTGLPSSSVTSHSSQFSLLSAMWWEMSTMEQCGCDLWLGRSGHTSQTWWYIEGDDRLAMSRSPGSQSNGSQKNEASVWLSVVEDSAFSSLECFDTVGWATRRASGLCPFGSITTTKPHTHTLIYPMLTSVNCLLTYFTTPQPFYGPFPGPPGWAGARRELLDFMVQGKINRGRHANRPAGRHSIRTNQCPPPPSSPYFFTGRMPFLPPNQQRQSTEDNRIESQLIRNWGHVQFRDGIPLRCCELRVDFGVVKVGCFRCRMSRVSE